MVPQYPPRCCAQWFYFFEQFLYIFNSIFALSLFGELSKWFWYLQISRQVFCQIYWSLFELAQNYLQRVQSWKLSTISAMFHRIRLFNTEFAQMHILAAEGFMRYWSPTIGCRNSIFPLPEFNNPHHCSLSPSLLPLLFQPGFRSHYSRPDMNSCTSQKCHCRIHHYPRLHKCAILTNTHRHLQKETVSIFQKMEKGR